MGINVDVGYIFTNALTEVISTVSGFSLEVLSQEPDNYFDDMIGIMNFHGEINGVLFVSSNAADMRALCSYMIGVPLSEVLEEDVDDALNELTNMTAGNAKIRFGYLENVFHLSPPFVVKGKGMAIGTRKKTRMVSRTLGNGEITVKFKVIY